MTIELGSAKGKKWQLIYFINSQEKKPFLHGEELYHSTENTKFSILGVISPIYRVRGFYEFLMKHEYDPSLHSPTYLHWKQSINPLDTQPGDTEIGFIPIYVPEYSVPFKGLAKSSQYQDTTFIDGTPGMHIESNWWYAIVPYRIDNPSYTTSPGPPLSDNNGNRIGAIRTYLWIRFPSSTLPKNMIFSRIKISLLFISFYI